MIVRTISQLPEANLEDFSNNNYYEMSKATDIPGKFISKKISQTLLNSYYTSTIDNYISAKYQLYDNDGNTLSVHSLISNIENVVSGDNIKFVGKKIFTEAPYVNNEKIVISSDLSSAIENQSTFIQTETDDLISRPGVTTSKDPNDKTINVDSVKLNDDEFLKFKLEPNGSGSRSYKLNDETLKSNPVCDKTGNLMLYGWLCDTGNLINTQCWVTLEGMIKDSNGNKRWQILQVQPWILGTNHTNIQYIGFNVPVKKGLELRISTGFPVNLAQSNLNGTNSLALTIGSSVPANCFVGYIN